MGNKNTKPTNVSLPISENNNQEQEKLLVKFKHLLSNESSPSNGNLNLLTKL